MINTYYRRLRVRLCGMHNVIQVQEYKVNFPADITSIGSGHIPANAIDESKKNSNFKKNFQDYLHDLDLEQQIVEIEESPQTTLNHIKKTIQIIPLMKEKNEYHELSEKLTQLIKTLVKEIKKNNCDLTKKTLQDIFSDVDSSLFKTHISYLNKELKK